MSLCYVVLFYLKLLVFSDVRTQPHFIFPRVSYSFHNRLQDPSPSLSPGLGLQKENWATKLIRDHWFLATYSCPKCVCVCVGTQILNLNLLEWSDFFIQEVVLLPGVTFFECSAYPPLLVGLLRYIIFFYQNIVFQVQQQGCNKHHHPISKDSHRSQIFC